MDTYDNLTIGDIVSELQLQQMNVNIYNNSLIAIPTGKIASDGSKQYKIIGRDSQLIQVFDNESVEGRNEKISDLINVSQAKQIAITQKADSKDTYHKIIGIFYNDEKCTIEIGYIENLNTDIDVNITGVPLSPYLKVKTINYSSETHVFSAWVYIMP